MNPAGSTIEDIILTDDRRGVAELRHLLPPDFCRQAAQYLLDNPGPAAIATGFYILAAGQPETDGPPGAVAIGNALQALGRPVSYITDHYTAPLLGNWLGGRAAVIEFPITSIPESKQAAAELVDQIRPDLLISIERCGRNRRDCYLNMLARDITAYTARIDYLFEMGIPSVGIGDGGNEIGMGNLADHIPPVDRLPDEPAITTVDKLVMASVSNWGGYGLVAALSQLTGRNLLPSVAEDTRFIRQMVDAGAVDGGSGINRYYVDNFTLKQNAAILTALQQQANKGVQ